MLIEAGEEFTAERVISLALQQNIGPDPSMARRKQHYLYKHQMDDRKEIRYFFG